MNSCGWNRSAIFTLITIVLSVTSSALGATRIAVRERVVVASSVVRLGDVAEVVSADRTEGRTLAAMPLMPAPAPGTERFLQMREIQDLLTARGRDLRTFEFEGAAQVAIAVPAAVSNSVSPVPAKTSSPNAPENIHAAILAGQLNATDPTAFDAGTAKRLRDGMNRAIARYLEAETGRTGIWHVECDLADRHLALVAGAKGAMGCQGGREPFIGTQRFMVSVNSDQGAVQFPVYAEVTCDSLEFAVAIRPIARGEVITAADVELQTLDSLPASNNRRAPIESLDKLVGMEARQAIQTGDVVYTDQVQAPQLVKRGEIITVASQGGGIRVRTTARAQQDGALGDLVQVESLESKARYDVRVVGMREAAVYTAVRPPVTTTADKQRETARR